MFKKILIGVILLFLIGSVAGCDRGAQIPEGPGETRVAPSLIETPPVEDQTKNSEKVVAVPEFIERALDGEYNEGDMVLVSGVVEDIHLKTKEEVSASIPSSCNTIILGPRTLKHFVRVESKGVNEVNKSDEGYDSFMSMMKVKVGDKVTVKGTLAHIDGQRIYIIDATVQ